MLRTIAHSFLVVLVVQPLPATAQEELRELGARAAHFMRASYFLQAASSGECEALVLRRHDPEQDFANLLAHIPKEVNSFFREQPDILDSTKAEAVREVAELRERFSEGSSSPELRCGLLLGVAVATYYQGRSRWAELTLQEKPVVVRP